jgi:crotonobetainyl-CoA:carnitine CoA-transferase CaiB-like acyl-CoA transferase
MEANPRLIWCAITGFGLDGPLRDEPSFDIVTQALTGVMSVNGPEGGPPTKIGPPIGDMSGGIFGAISILAALHERHATGRGRLIDVSLYDGTLSLLAHFAQLPALTGADPTPMGSRHPSVVPYDAFPARDGTVVIACLADRFWPRLCAALDAPELAADPRYATTALRRDHRATLEPRIAELTAAWDVAELTARLREHDVPHAPVLGVSAALAHPHAAARGMVEEVAHPAAGTLRLLGRPVKFPGAPQPPLRPPPRLGEDTDAVLREVLGLGDADLAALRAAGAFG